MVAQFGHLWRIFVRRRLETLISPHPEIFLKELLCSSGMMLATSAPEFCRHAFRTMIFLYRRFIYFWIASALLGCSLPPTFTNDIVVPGPSRDTSTPIESPSSGAETSSLPEARTEAVPDLSLHEYSESPAMSEKAVELQQSPQHEPHRAEKSGLAREKTFTLTDDNLVNQWQKDMDHAMEQPVGQRVLRISPTVEAHHRVRYYINGFCGRLRDFFERALARSGKYRSMMAEILRSEGLPEKLVFLALIESGFSTTAYSRAHALGPWQFIRSTALHYGLAINPWVDERRDPVLSTRAAAAYLKDLHQRFGEWYLAAAAYNAGEGRVGTALKRAKTNDFWRLRNARHHLKLETRDYIPKFVAAALIGREPEKYGFEEISYEEPWQFDEVIIDRPLRLETVARMANTNVEVIKELNPALLRNFTPPTHQRFTLRLPAGSQTTFLDAYGDLPASGKIKLSLHKVKRGDILGRIAKKHGLTVNQLIKENGLKGNRLRPGQELIIVANDTASEPLRLDVRRHLVHKTP
jgi:soluble lytic murein transglycosylase-like protein